MKEAIYIPLGTRCSSCSIIDGQFGLRKFALPFDWVDISVSSIQHMITVQDVDDFCEKYFSPKNISKQKSIVDQTWFPHHLTDPDKFYIELAALKDKFCRRLKRLRELFSNPEIDFVFLTTWGHVGDNEQDYYRLIDTISSIIKRYAFFISINLSERQYIIGKHINFNIPLGETWEQYDIDVANKLRTHGLTKEYFK